MALVSKTYHRVGKIEFLAILVGDDPERPDCNIDVDSRVFTTRAAAKRWAAQQMKAGRGFSADIYERVWEENAYVDHVYGAILDADTVEVSSQYGWLGADGRARWDPVEKA